MYYAIRNQLEEVGSFEIQKEPFVAVISYADLSDSMPGGFNTTLVTRLEKVRFCKAESHQGVIYGTFSIPNRKHLKKQSSFSFCMNKKCVVFVDDSDYVNTLIKKIAETSLWKQPSIGRFIFSFLETLIAEDLELLESIEDYLSKMEISVLDDKLEKFNHRMMAVRKAILMSSHYYSQLEDITHAFMQNDDDIFNKQDRDSFSLFYDRVFRLHGETEMLREYSMEINEVYQAQIDIYQNKVMKILTIVTTVFLPLTLIAGWYGMNFKYMPELGWTYGYPFAMLLSVAVVVFCLWQFKRQKYW